MRVKRLDNIAGPPSAKIEPRRTWRRHAIRWAIRSACTSVVLLLIFWFTLQHKPGWYRPAELDEVGLADARREATAAADSFSDQLVRGKPFDFALEGESVTRWLGAMHEIAPEIYSQLPPELSAPAVSFEDGAVRIGVHMESKGWRIVASAAVTAAVADEGRAIDFQLTGLSGGSFPLPRALVLRVLGEESRNEIKVLDGGETVSIADLLGGVRIDNDFVWPNGQRRFRVQEMEAGGGRLRLRIEPK